MNIQDIKEWYKSECDSNIPEGYEFTLSEVDGLLRAFLFSTRYLQNKLPGHMYDYINSKLETFLNSLEKQLRKNK